MILTLKKAKNNFEKIEILNKTKTHRPNRKTDFSPVITQKNKEKVTCPVKIDRVEAEIQAHTRVHAHTHAHAHTRAHAHAHVHAQLRKINEYNVNLS